MKFLYLTLFFLLLLSPAFSQTGPGGVGNSTTNKLWLSADKDATSGGLQPTNNGSVDLWFDRSGNGNAAIQNTTSFRPTFKTNVANGKPVLRFDGSNDRILATLSASTSPQASVFVVASYSSLPSSNPGLIQGSPLNSAFGTQGTDKSIGMWVQSADLVVWGRAVQSNGTLINMPRTTTVTGNAFHGFHSKYAASNMRQYLDGMALTDTIFNGNLQSHREFGIGRQGVETWAGDIAEVILYNYAVNDAQRIIIDNYLAAKYGYTLSTNDLYTMDNAANGNYDHDMAGIGRTDAQNTHTAAKGSIVRIDNPQTMLNNDFTLFGHNNLALSSVGVTDLPSGVNNRLARVWRASVQGFTTSVDVSFDLSGFAVNTSDLVLLRDLNNNGSFNDEFLGAGVTSGATSVGNGIYKFTFVNIPDGTRFTLGSLNAQTPLGVEDELTMQGRIGQVYPNPANGSVLVSGYSPKAVVEVYNALGQKVQATLPVDHSGESTIDTSHLEEGVFMVRVSAGGSSQTHRLVIEH